MDITVDAYTDGGNATATSLIFSHTTGSIANGLLLVGIRTADTNGNDNVTGVTYNSIAMTRIVTDVWVANAWRVYIYALLQPTTGANNVVVSVNPSSFIKADAITFSGAKQSIPLDGFTNTQVVNTTPLLTTITTVADNCWMYGFGFNDVANWTAGTATTALSSGYSFRSTAAFTPAGSHSLSVNAGGGNFNGIAVAASLAPIVVSTNYLQDYRNDRLSFR